MTNLIPFAFEDALVRVVTDERGEPLFVGKDICLALGYSNDSDAMKRHCKGVVKRYPLQTSGGVQEVRVLSEADMFRLVVNSTLPSAEAFERLVFEEILPAIRKTGFYAAANAGQQAAAMIKVQGQIIKLMNTLDKATHQGQREVIYQLLVEAQASIGMKPKPLAELVTPLPTKDPLVAEFWLRVARLEGMGIELNHSRDRHLVAINMPEFIEACSTAGMKIIPAADIKRALKSCPRLRGIRTVNSAINSKWNKENPRKHGRSVTMKCHVFTAEGDASC